MVAVSAGNNAAGQPRDERREALLERAFCHFVNQPGELKALPEVGAPWKDLMRVAVRYAKLPVWPEKHHRGNSRRLLFFLYVGVNTATTKYYIIERKTHTQYAQYVRNSI